VLAAGIAKAAGSHSFRHSQWLRHAGLRPGKATLLLERGQTIRTIQELLGHSDVRTTMINTHMLNRSPLGGPAPPSFCSPANRGLQGPVSTGLWSRRSWPCFVAEW
jgi:hypothetical protein